MLERNLCFVDTSSSTKLEHIVRYTEQQLALAMNCMATVGHDSAGLLSGRGGSQVDVILYLVMKGEQSPKSVDRVKLKPLQTI